MKFIVQIGFCLALFWFLPGTAFGQLDTVRVYTESGGSIATKGHVPHYQHANRWDLLRQDEADAYLLTGVTSGYQLSKQMEIRAGLSAMGSTQFNRSRLQEYYLEGQWNVFLVHLGSREHTIGLNPELLSSGSLIFSPNARPMPMAGVGIREFVAIPLTRGFLALKGMINHGWLEKDRFVENPFLHQKYVYLKIGASKKVSFTGGLVHNAQWAGKNDVRGQLPNQLADFRDVFLSRSIDASRDTAGVLGPEIENALGNHLGVFEYALDVELKEWKISVYHQTPFEDNSSLKQYQNPDGLTGIHLKPPERKKWWPAMVYEVLHTKYQSGPGTPDVVPGQSNYGYRYGGRDDFYNNIIYRNGWTYDRQILGTPLFHTADRAATYVEDLQDFNNFIVNNRVTAHHFALMGKMSEQLSYRSLITYTNNFGTYNGLNDGGRSFASIEDPDFDYFFAGGLWQMYTMIELKYTFKEVKGLEVTIAPSVDFGKLSNNVGVFGGIRWQGDFIKKQVD